VPGGARERKLSRLASDKPKMTTLDGRFWRACISVSIGAVLLAPAAAGAALDRREDATPVVRYADTLRSFNPALSSPQARDIATHVLLLSSYYHLDARLLIALVAVESNWRSGAVSPVGAQGLGQLMPATASGLDVLAYDKYENLDGTARYLRRMVQRYAALSPEARYERALASYNAGPGAVARFGGVPPFAETRAYVARVTKLWHQLQTSLPGTGAPAAVVALATPQTVTSPPAAHRVHAPIKVSRGTVAAFAQLEVISLQELESEAASLVAVATPAPARKRGVGGWLSRAFGSH
jgi:hypothetical protein